MKELHNVISNLSCAGGSFGAGGGNADYDDQADIVRFLEDGSFIGQYGKWTKQKIRKTSGIVVGGSIVAETASAPNKDDRATSLSTTALSSLV